MNGLTGPRSDGAATFARRFGRLLSLCAALGLARPGYAQPTGDLTLLSLEQLLDVSVVGASKYEQKQSDVAATVSIITRQEIKAFGWRTLAEALGSLPGVQTTPAKAPPMTAPISMPLRSESPRR